jgi:hypothetical protein
MAQNPSSKLDGDFLSKAVEEALSFLGSANEIARVEFDPSPASGADDPVVRFHPSDALTHFVAALRALERDFFVEQADHRFSPMESVSHVAVAKSSI